MINVLNLGAGVQSTTIYLMSCLGELPKVDCAIFADTEWEPTAVYRHLEWLEKEIAPKYGIPIHRVRRGNLKEDMLNWKVFRDSKKARPRMPLFLLNPDGSKGMINRQCTPDYKIVPIERFIKTTLLGIQPKKRWPKELTVRQWFGISMDETQRCSFPRRKVKVKLPDPTLFDASHTKSVTVFKPVPWRSHVYPLCGHERFSDGTFEKHDDLFLMTRDDCKQWCKAHGFPEPPRSACKGCNYHNDAEWLKIKENPEDWEEVCQFDESIRSYDAGKDFDGLRGQCFLHSSRIPLREVKLTNDEYSKFQCEDGLCGV